MNVIFVLPTATKDALIGVRKLQYSSKCGRRLTGMKGMEIYTGVIVLLLGTMFSFATLKYKSRMRDNDEVF